MGNRRMTRLTNAFRKKAENHAHTMAIYFMHYNFVRIHQSLKVTPAMAAGVTSKLGEMADLGEGAGRLGSVADCRITDMSEIKWLLREVVWVILDQFRAAVFFCCCRCGHVGNALALSIMSTAVLDVGAVDL